MCAHLNQTSLLKPQTTRSKDKSNEIENKNIPTMSEVLGQDNAKRALTIAAAGHHHVLMIGSPGSGKTMLANRFLGLLPKMI